MKSAVFRWFATALVVGITHGASARAALEQSAGTGSVPFDSYLNLIFVQVRINGSGPYSFLLDTGANSAFLNEALARTLGLGPKQSFHAQVGAGDSSTSLGYARHVTLSLGNIELPPATAVVTSLDRVEARIGREIDGIVGSAVFKRFVVTIDPDSHMIALSDPSRFSYHGPGETVPLRISGDRPFIKTRVTPIGATALDVKLAVDTGDTGALSFHTAFVLKHDLRAPNQTLLPSTSTGLSGESRNWRGRAASLQIGRITINRPLAKFSEGTQGSDADASYDGLIGGQVLHRFRIVFDYSRERMFVEPGSSFQEPYEADMSGLTLSGRGAHFRTITVDNIATSSAAAKAGLEVADVIENVNGQSTASMTLEEVVNLFKQDGGQFLLGVRRGPEVVQLTMRTYRLI